MLTQHFSTQLAQFAFHSCIRSAWLPHCLLRF